MSGETSGTNAALRLAFLYTWAAVAMLSAGINALNVLTELHNEPALGLMPPLVSEATSWLTAVLFLWIPWIGFRLGYPFGRPYWRLLIHLPAGFAYSLIHVSGFVLLRLIIYRLQGGYYDFGPFWTNFFYELRKDALAYALYIAGFAFVLHSIRMRHPLTPPQASPKFDIRDGAKLNRVLIDDILAVSSAGNYVEFVLRHGAKLTMRSSLSALENDLRAYGFLRTHRCWLVNPRHMTALQPQGSGDYTVFLGTISVPLSRRFSAALVRLRSENISTASEN